MRNCLQCGFLWRLPLPGADGPPCHTVQHSFLWCGSGLHPGCLVRPEPQPHVAAGHWECGWGELETYSLNFTQFVISVEPHMAGGIRLGPGLCRGGQDWVAGSPGREVTMSSRGGLWVFFRGPRLLDIDATMCVSFCHLPV